MPIFSNPFLLSRLCEAIADRYNGTVHAVAATEARGLVA